MEVLVKDLIHQAVQMLASKGITDARNDSWLLAEYVFEITKADYYMNPGMTVEQEKSKRYMALVKKRADKIPLQYITGEQEFMGLNFTVNENVLIPRQDTELLVEKTAEYVRMLEGQVKVLDMCTGSGCIAISVDKLCPDAQVTAADISYKALAVALENNKKNKADVCFVQSNLFDNIEGCFDIIVSNPPYIKTGELSDLMEEVREHEPMLALDGDNDGLKFYRQIAKKLDRYLKKKGRIFFEIGYDQGQKVPEILEKYGFRDIRVFQDLSGNDRVVSAGKE